MQYINMDQGYGPVSVQPMGGSSQAVLWLFSKAFTPDYARRPMLYNFNGGFRHQLNERLSTVGTLGGWNDSKAFFNNSPDTANLILPSVHAEEVNMSIFSELWTFVLSVTNIRGTPAYTGIPPITSTEIFSGYLTDDPVSNVLMSSGHSKPINETAMLITTHHTTLNRGTTETEPFTVMADADLIPQQIVSNIQKNGVGIASLRPDKLAQGITVQGPFDSGIQTSPVPLDQTATGSEEVDVAYALPGIHVAKLTKGLANSIATTNFTNCVGDGDSMAELTTNLASSLQPGYSAMISPDVNKQKIRPDMPFSIHDISTAYPNTLVTICQQPPGQQVDLVDPMAPTVTNQMSSLISSCLPMLLTEYGFSEIIMRYCSWDKNPNPFIRGSYHIEHAATLCDVTPAIYETKLNALISDIIDRLFGVILANAGEFNVNINCSIGGASLVDLTLLDYASHNQNGFTLVDNRLGGLNSPMVGSYEASKANQLQLSSIIQDCVNTQSAKITPTYSLY